MEAAGFEALSDLVLVEILAALPLRQALRMMRLAGPKLRQICSRPWVVRRTTDVEFPTVVEAYLAGGDVRAALCIDAVLRKLYGKIVIHVAELNNDFYQKACLTLID